MADATSEVQSEQEKLKYLDFVEDAVQQVVVYASKVYDFAKEKAGLLTSGIETIETTVKTVIDPAIDKVHDVLKFVDEKVEESVTQLDKVLPPAVKEVITTTAKSLSTTDVKGVDVVETVKDLLVKIDPVAEEYASSVWQTLNQLPLVTKVVDAVAPAAIFITEKYNETVQQTAEEGYKVSSLLPLVPTEKIARVFSIPEAEPAAPGEEKATEEVPEGGEEAAEVPGEGEVVEEK